MNISDASNIFVATLFITAILHSISMAFIAWRIGKIADSIQKDNEGRKS